MDFLKIDNGIERDIFMISLSAQPEAIDLSLAQTALVIIDMQRDFLEPRASVRAWVMM